MKKNIFIYLIIFIPVILFNNCEEVDDFLEIEPKASIVTGSFYSDMDQANQAILAAYSTFNTTTQWDRNALILLGSIASDDAEAGGETANEVPDQEVINRMEHLATAPFLGEVYGNKFRGIYFSNLAIENLPRVADLDEDADEDLLEKRIAEAHFLRAINYFYLTKIFGGVPYVDRVIGPSDYNMGRSTIKEIYNLIESDLLHAIDVLPERSGWGSEVGRASKGAAKALLSRMYLYESSYAVNYPDLQRFEGMEERWDEALDYAERVIDSGEYGLVGMDGETFNTWWGENTNGYRYIFTTEGDNSPETVFEIQCVQEGLGYAAARGSSLPRWTTARYYLDEDGNDVSTGEWGLNWPTQSLVDAFEPGDPRLGTAIAQAGDTMQIDEDWFEVAAHRSETGYYTNKYVASGAERVAIITWDSFPANVKLIRIAEVFLNAAEAAYQMGENAKALGYVNTIRKRARDSGDTGVPADLGSITLEDIKNERRVELSLEGHRFYDLVRWRDANEKITRTTDDSAEYDVDWIYPKNVHFPLPQREVDVSEGGLRQYEGW